MPQFWLFYLPVLYFYNSINSVIQDDRAMVETEMNTEWIEPGGFHNPVLASFVTSYGRIELYRYLSLYGKNVFHDSF